MVAGLQMGGINRLLVQNAVQLRDLGVRNLIAYLNPNHELLSEYEDAGFNPVCLNYARRLSAPAVLIRLTRFIRSNQVDVIHANHELDKLFGAIAGKLTRTPVVTTFHETIAKETLLRQQGRFGFAVRSFLHRHFFAKGLAVSRAVADSASERYGIHPGDIEVVYSGVDNARFEPRPESSSLERLRAELELEGSHPVLLTVGRLYPTKGHRFLIPMVQQLKNRWPNIRLLIAGDGELLPEIQKQVDDAGLSESITLLGSRSDIPDLHRISDVFVFPSYSEGLGLVLIEAMASGLPVVASNVPPMDEVVDDGVTGKLVAAKDPEALAKGVEQVLSDTDINRFGTAGRRRVEARFNSRNTARQMKDIYLSVSRRS